MINSTQKWWGVAALALLCIAPCAFASSSLTMTGAGNNVMDGVYVGPYYATVSGVANSPVICDDFADESVYRPLVEFHRKQFFDSGKRVVGQPDQQL